MDELTTQERRVTLAAVLALAAFALWPSLQVGFVSDDVMLSLRNSEGSLDSLRAAHQNFVAGQARFLPVHFALFSTTWVGDLTLHRWVSLVAVLVAFGVAAAFMARVLNSPAAATLMFGLLPVALQFRTYHDPVLAFVGLVPGVMVLNVAAWWAFDRALEDRVRPAWLVASAVLLLAALWSYELSYAVLPVFAVLAWRRARLRWLVVPAGVVLLAAASNLAARWSGPHYAGVTPSLRPLAIATTFAKQTFGALPLSSRARPAHLELEVVVVYALLFGALFWGLRRVRRVPRARELAVTFALVLAPAAPIAFSAKYQSELRWGVAYLPVLAATAAVTALLAQLVLWLAPTPARWLLGVGLASALAAWNQSRNEAVCRDVALAFEVPRSFERRALEHGLLQAAPGVAGLVVSSPVGATLEALEGGWAWYSWDQPPLFAKLAATSFPWVMTAHWVRSSDGSEREPDAEWWRAHDGASVHFLGYRADATPVAVAWAAAGVTGPRLGQVRATGPVRFYVEGAAELEVVAQREGQGLRAPLHVEGQPAVQELDLGNVELDTLEVRAVQRPSE